MVPFKPVLDRVLIQELPRPENKVLAATALGEIVQSQHFEKPYDRGIVVAVGDGVPMGGVLLPIPYEIGDVVIMGEYGRDQVYIDPADEFKKEVPKYFLMRIADTRGKDLRYQKGGA